MNDITNTKTADLIAEWEKLENRTFSLEYLAELRVSLNDRKAAIAAELDSRLQVMDIEHGGNYTEARNYMEDPYNDWVDGEATSKNLSEAEIKKIEMGNLRELRDLLTWLLLKGGGRG